MISAHLSGKRYFNEMILFFQCVYVMLCLSLPSPIRIIMRLPLSNSPTYVRDSLVMFLDILNSLSVFIPECYTRVKLMLLLANYLNNNKDCQNLYVLFLLSPKLFLISSCGSWIINGRWFRGPAHL